MIIAVDGPAASGKEKISKYISKKWKLNHLDTGILYRRLAFILILNKVDTNSVQQIKKKIKDVPEISFRNSRKIRTQKKRRKIHKFERRRGERRTDEERREEMRRGEVR